MKTFNIIKKNRKYFSATSGGYKCRILIDANSEGLELGEHTFEIIDLSIRSKYGIDSIFRLKGSVAEQEDAGICSLKHRKYNTLLRDAARAHNGKWEGLEKAWIFSGLIANEIDALDEVFNSPTINVEVTFTEGLSTLQAPVTFIGYVLARAWGRDSGAQLEEGFAVVSGEFSSGGSVKNWRTKASDGTTIRMSVPSLLLKQEEGNFKAAGIEYRVLD